MSFINLFRESSRSCYLRDSGSVKVAFIVTRTISRENLVHFGTFFKNISFKLSEHISLLHLVVETGKKT